MKILIATDEGEVIVIAGMPADEAINKWYRCKICPKCRCNLQAGQCACVEKYYSEVMNDVK